MDDTTMMGSEETTKPDPGPLIDQEQEQKDKDISNEDDNDAWLDVLENKQLLKKILVPGDETSSRPQRSQKCVIHVKTSLKEDGREVPSESGNDIVAFVGDYDVVHGVDLALGLMNIGETSLVQIHPRFGFGDTGKDPDVPANSTLCCEVTLVSVESVDIETGDLSLSDRIKYGSMKKERGNFWFGRKDFNSAIHCYKRAIEFADATDDEMVMFHSIQGSSSSSSVNGTRGGKILTDSQKEQEKLRYQVQKLVLLRSTCFNNLAAAQIKVDALDQALISVTSSLDLDPTNVKALYRKSKILAEKADLAEAIDILKIAVKIEPESKTLSGDLTRLSGRYRAQLDKEKKMYQRMLDVKNNPGSNNSTNGNKTKSSTWKQTALFAGLGCAIVVAGVGVAMYRVGKI